MIVAQNLVVLRFVLRTESKSAMESETIFTNIHKQSYSLIIVKKKQKLFFIL